MEEETMTNKFVSFLDRIGKDFKLGAEKALALETKLLPAEEAIASGVTLVDPAVGVTLKDLLMPIVGIQQAASALNASTGTGAQKLAVALPQFERALLSDPLFKGKTVANLPLYNSTLTTLTGAFADLMAAFSGETGTTATGSAS